MWLKAKMMLRIGKDNVNPGECFEAPQSQAVLLIINGMAVEEKKAKAAESKDKDTKKK